MSDDIKLRYFAVETIADVESLVLKAVEAANTMKQRVQYAAVALMIGSTIDADKAVELANKLAHELGHGVKAEGLVKFMVQKGGFRLDADGKSFESVKGEQWIRDNLQSAKDTPWWTFAPATPFKGFVLNEELKSIIKRAKAAVETAAKDETKAAKIDVDVNMIETLQALIGGNPVQAEGAIHLIERIIPHKDEHQEAPRKAEA